MLGGRKPTRVEVEEVKHLKLRVILIAVSVVLALSAFGYGIHALVNKDKGWQTIECASSNINCSQDFTLQYFCGATEFSASAEYKAVTALYSQATEDAYKLFYLEGELSGINARPNDVLEVSPALYDALELIQKSGNRCLYLGPVYEEYNRIFFSQSEVEAQSNDPAQNPEIAAYVVELAAFSNDPASVDIELLGDNRICLRVSDAYLEYARENEIVDFLDFGWMQNAFIADYIAGVLAAQGYTSGYLASYDGFTRNLDEREQSYSMNLFDRLGDVLNRPAVMEYNGPMSIVFLRNYPMSNADRWHYYSFADGRIATAFVDPTDGMSKSSTDNIVVYCQTASCAEILLDTAPIYLADSLDESALESMAQQGIHSVWFENAVLKHTQDSLVIRETEDAAKLGYQIH